jgi:SAM-dependent methyltransferase
MFVGQPMDYDGFAEEYAEVRWPFPWILEPLARAVSATRAGSTILEVGCGTGNYVNALAEQFPDRSFHGFDQSKGMLGIAGSRSRQVSFARADAERVFPFKSGTFDLIFLVDVLHHIESLPALFSESARTLREEGTLAIVTDSEENIRSRSLTKFFPELLDLEMKRYPEIGVVHAAARKSGLMYVRSEPAEGFIDLDSALIDRLARKGSSGLRLIASEDHARGMKRVREAGAKGERWYSCYTVLYYTP